jgi:hypothetical protein
MGSKKTTLADILVFMGQYDRERVWRHTLQKHFPECDIDYLVNLGVLYSWREGAKSVERICVTIPRRRKGKAKRSSVPVEFGRVREELNARARAQAVREAA